MRLRTALPAVALVVLVLALLPQRALGRRLEQPRANVLETSMSLASSRIHAPDGFFGVVIRDPFYELNLTTNEVRKDFIDAMLSNVAAAGAEWVRFEFHASYDGRNGGYGVFVMEQADYLVERAHKHGLKVLALINTNILKGPGEELWNFNDYPVALEYCNPVLGCGLTPYMEHFLARALELARYYRGRIDAYEILNEPNRYYGLVGARAKRGQPYQDELNPERVARTVAQFYHILRQHGDTTPLILGGIHPAGSSQTGRTDIQYIHALYRSHAFQSYKDRTGRWPVDGVGYHPYAQELSKDGLSQEEFLVQAPRRLQDVIAAVRTYDSTSKLWITEIGAKAHYLDGPAMQAQADFLRLVYEMTWQFRQDIATVLWFKHEDWPASSASGPHEESWGFVHIPVVYEERSYYADPWRYSADLRQWTVKSAFLTFRDLALNGIPAPGL